MSSWCLSIMTTVSLRYILCIVILISFSLSSSAQSTPPKDELLFDTYQIFLNESIKKIKKLEYETEEKRLKGYLIDDKTGIILENYDGKHRVKITYEDINGEVKTLLKSKCYIDPVIPL